MDRFEISDLLSYYGCLLTEKQQDLMTMHYHEDLSYGEIADIVGSTRQAVLDSINKGEKHLVNFDKKLELIKKDNEIKKLLEEILTNTKDEKTIECINKIQQLMEE